MLYIMKVWYCIGVHNVISHWVNLKIEKHIKRSQLIIKWLVDKIILQIIIIFIEINKFEDEV